MADPSEPPDTFENREHRRKKQRLSHSNTPADLKVEKAALAAALEEEAGVPPDQRKATGAARSRKQSRADLYKSWWQSNSYRRMRAMLFRFAPELVTPRFGPAVEYIASQQVLYRRLLEAHERQQEQYDALYESLKTMLDGLPPLKEWNAETSEILDKLHDLLKSFHGANPFQYVDKIENVAAKILALLREAGLTPKAARMMEINVEEELRQYKGEVAAAQADDGDAPHESNAARRKRLMKHDGEEAVDDSENDTEPPEGEEEEDNE